MCVFLRVVSNLYFLFHSSSACPVLLRAEPNLICSLFLSCLDPRSIFPSDLLQRIASYHVYAKWSAVAKPPSEHLIKSLPSSCPPANLSHEEIKLPVTTFKEFLSSPPTTYHPCWISSPPTSSHLQQHCSPQRSMCWRLIFLLSFMPCFFCRAAMSHPCISIYIQFSEKTTCMSLPTDCNPPWPKLQRLFRKSLTHYS